MPCGSPIDVAKRPHETACVVGLVGSNGDVLPPNFDLPEHHGGRITLGSPSGLRGLPVHHQAVAVDCGDVLQEAR